ncbi:MAG: hypothetical protein RLY21_142 [Planctomycetota bacterium]|jgi:hypothetical protein
MRSILSTAVAALAASLSLAVGGTATAQQGAPLPSTLATPNVYVVPLKGQMGTDISMQLMKMYVEDIKKVKPDIIVLELFSADVNQNFYLPDDDTGEFGLGILEEYRDMVKMFREDLRDIPQVMWVEDSVGFGSLLALAWSDMYIRSDGRLMGLARVSQMAQGWDDPDVASKMMRARVGIGNGFLQQGGYPLELGEAMMTPDETLSIKFEGRKVVWLPNTTGTWIVDGTKENVANFSATLAEESGLADGVADDLDDLMFLLGYREYNRLENGEKLGARYVEDWRKAFERCKDWMRDASEVDGDAAGLGKQKSLYEKVVAAIKQYPAIEYRMRMEGLPGRVRLELEIENLRKEIQRIRDAEKGSRGSGGSSGGGRPGLGGGGFGGRR